MARCSWLASVGEWAPTLGQKWHIPVLFKVLNHSFTWPQEIHDHISCWYLPEHVKYWGHIFLPHNLHNKWFKMNCVCIAGLQKSYSLYCLSQLCITWFFSPQKSTCLLHVWQCFPIGGKFYFLEKTQPRVHPVTYRVIFAINSRFFFSVHWQIAITKGSTCNSDNVFLGTYVQTPERRHVRNQQAAQQELNSCFYRVEQMQFFPSVYHILICTQLSVLCRTCLAFLLLDLIRILYIYIYPQEGQILGTSSYTGQTCRARKFIAGQ